MHEKINKEPTHEAKIELLSPSLITIAIFRSKRNKQTNKQTVKQRNRITITLEKVIYGAASESGDDNTQTR